MISRISLDAQLKIPLYVEGGVLKSADETNIRHVKTISLSNVITQTINSELTYPENFGNVWEITPCIIPIIPTSLKFEIVMLSGSLLGIEFAKTCGVKTVAPYSTYIQILHGRACIVLQESFFDEQSFSYNVSKAYAVRLERGNGFIIPPGMSYTLVNTRFSDMLAIKVLVKEARELNDFESHRGAAIYVIHKNSKVELVQNPNIKMICDCVKIKKKDLEKSIFAKSMSIEKILEASKTKGLDQRIDCVMGRSEYDLDKTFGSC